MFPGVSAEDTRKAVVSGFFSSGASWSSTPERDNIVDYANVLIFNPEPTKQGRVQLTLYSPQANLATFAYHHAPGLEGVKDGFLFDCDSAELNPSVVRLNKPNFRAWLNEASDINRSRVVNLLGQMGLEP